MWRRAPMFFAGKIRDKVFGADESWLAQPMKAVVSVTFWSTDKL